MPPHRNHPATTGADDDMEICRCVRCSQAPEGFMYQKRRTAANHQKRNLRISHDVRSAQSARGLGQGSTMREREATGGNRMTILEHTERRGLEGLEIGGGSGSGLVDPDRSAIEGDSEASAQTAPSPPPPPLYPPGPPLGVAPQLRVLAQPGEIFTDVLPAPPISKLPDDENDTQGPHIPAMREEPWIRMAYLNAVLGNVFGKLTWEYATSQLRASFTMLRMAGRLPDDPAPVRTLLSARRRLGIDPDVHIIEYTLCPTCWGVYTPAQLSKFLPEDPECRVNGCTGILFECIGGIKSSILFCPQVSLVSSIRRMFSRPGFGEKVRRQVTRTPGRNANEDFLMRDIFDGEMWYKSTTGTKRQQGNRGTVRDISVDGREQPTRLYTQEYGLQFTLNLDWYVHAPFL